MSVNTFVRRSLATLFERIVVAIAVAIVVIAIIVVTIVVVPVVVILVVVAAIRWLIDDIFERATG